MKRRDVLKGIGGALSLAATGASLPAISRAQGANVLKFVPQADLAVIDPIMSAAFVTRNHAAMVFDTLWSVDSSFTPKPQMAAGHVVENDGKIWRVTLRDGLKFHDDTPVLARDAVASVKRWMARDSWGKDVAALTDDVSATSDKELVFKLKRPYRLLADALGKPGGSMPAIMPERLAATDPAKAVAEIVGSGPFKYLMSERVAGSRNVYEKFAGYVPRQEKADFTSGGKVAHFDRVEWITMPDAATAAAALQNGEVDWWEQPTADLLPLFKDNADFVTDVLDPGGLVMMIRMNHLQPPFNNPAIRRAILGAIKQSDYLIAAMGVDPATWIDNVGFFQPRSNLASDVGLDVFAGDRNFEKVKSDLAAAGYKGGKVVLLVPTDFPVLNAMSEVTADMLRKIGMNVDFQAMDWGTQVQRLNSKEPVENGGWSLWCNYASGAAAMTPAAHTYLRATGDGSIWGWPKSATIEDLRNEWIESSDLAQQQEISRQLQKAAFEDLPYVPLGIGLQSTTYSKSLQDMLKGFPIFYNVRRA